MIEREVIKTKGGTGDGESGGEKQVVVCTVKCKVKYTDCP